MSQRKIQILRRNSKRWAYAISWSGVVVALLCFVSIAALSDPIRVWPVRGFMLAFISILAGWGLHYGFIVVDEVMHRHYVNALFMSAVIAVFGLVVLSCVRAMIDFR